MTDYPGAQRVEVIGDATLILGDALDVLPTLGAVDAIITDPLWPTCPPDWSKDPGSLFCDAMYYAPDASVVVVVLGFDCDPRFLSGVPDGFRFLRYQTLPYVVPGYRGRLLAGDEIAYVFGAIPAGRGVIPGRAAAETTPRARRATGHPFPRSDSHMTQLCGWWSTAGGTVLDPFMGTGATGIGAVNLGRKFIGIEIEPRYFEIACERIDQALRQGRMFA